MRVTFSLPLKPFSVNQMFYGRSNGHTPGYRDWEAKCIYQLAKVEAQEALRAIRESFDPAKHALVMRMTFYYPRDIFYNKQGLASSKCFDLTNSEKPLLDIICLPKFHVQSLPYGCPNLNLDDKHVIGLTSLKRIAKDDKHSMRIAICLVPKLA